MMLLTISELSDYSIQATDGEIGDVDELYFQHEGWRVRYLVVNLGNWLTRQQVLIVPEVITGIDSDNKNVVVNLTRQQIENSPDILADMPVSREKEVLLHQHFHWQPYWIGFPSEGMAYGTNAAVQNLPDQSIYEHDVPENDADFRQLLRSTKAVTGYTIQATDNDIGHVEDFIVDTDNWDIRYLIIDTRNWLPGRQVLVAADWVQGIHWEESAVKIALTKERIENSPEYDPDRFNREYETRLYDHYDHPVYWD
ncbi:MAG: PRC-barrel domain-containing protein [Chloroflexota bacterium]